MNSKDFDGLLRDLLVTYPVPKEKSNSVQTTKTDKLTPILQIVKTTPKPPVPPRSSSHFALHLFGVTGLFSGIIFALTQLDLKILKVPALANNTNNSNNTSTTLLAQASGERLPITASIEDPSDLLVAEGDIVKAGQVLADKARDRRRLEAQKKQVELSIQAIQSNIPVPPREPQAVPPIPELPPTSIAPQEAAVASAELALKQARRRYSLALEGEPLIRPMAALEEAKAAATTAERAVQQQSDKLAAIQQIPDLPPEVMQHEAMVLYERNTERTQAKSKIAQREAEFTEAKQLRTELMQKLADDISKAEVSLQTAQGNLQLARDRENHRRYQHSLSIARRIEESNQANQSHARQKAAYQNNLQQRQFRLAQLQERAAVIEDNLAKLAIIKAPFAGQVRTIRTRRQTDNTLQVEITLIANPSGRTITPSTSSENPFN